MIPSEFTAPTPKSAPTAPKAAPVRVPVSLLNSDCPPGECLAFIESIPDEEARRLVYAEYCHYTGNCKEALSITEPYLGNEDPVLRNTACLVNAFANLSSGHVHFAQFSIAILKKYYSAQGLSQIPQFHAMGLWTIHAVGTLLHIPYDNTEPLEDWLRYLPDGLKLFACYLVAHRMCTENKFQGAHAVAKISVDLSSRRFVVSEIYCKLIDSVALVNLKRIEDAEKQFLAAWELASADGFLAPFSEHYLMLQGITERCLRTKDPEAYRRITEGAAVFSKNWRTLHNEEAGGSVSTELTITEFSIAMLYTRGWSAKEIAAHLDMSVRTVYRHISNIYAALGVRNVGELKAYVLK